MKTNLFTIFILLLFVACTPNVNDFHSNEIEDEVEIVLVGKDIEFDFSNTNNPYDFVGDIHNQILQEFMTACDFESASIESISMLIKSITLNNSDYHQRFSDKSYVSLSESQISNGMNDVFNNYSNIIDTLGFSKIGNIVFKDLIKAIHTFEGTASDYYNYIVNLEDTYINSMNLSGDELEVFLAATSVARHSYFFWLIQEKDMNNVIFNSGKGSSLFIIGADVFGAIAGGVYGGLGGGIAGAGLASGLASWIDDYL